MFRKSEFLSQCLYVSYMFLLTQVLYFMKTILQTPRSLSSFSLSDLASVSFFKGNNQDLMATVLACRVHIPRKAYSFPSSPIFFPFCPGSCTFAFCLQLGNYTRSCGIVASVFQLGVMRLSQGANSSPPTGLRIQRRRRVTAVGITHI